MFATPRNLFSTTTLIVAMAASAFVTLPAIAGVVGSTAATNTDDTGLALGGYDPVAFFDGGKPALGSESILAEHAGAHYRFATEAHRTTFLADPEHHVPQFSGFCTVGAAYGEKVEVDPTTGIVVDGKLYLNHDDRVSTMFQKDEASLIHRAEASWPGAKDKAL